MVDFAGFAMPVLYRDITSGAPGRPAARRPVRPLPHGPGPVHRPRRPEARHDRPDPGRRRPCSPAGRATRSLCLADGTTLDDILISREEAGFLLVINAGNRDADLEFFRTHARGLDVTITDDSERLAMLAVQGPAARARASPPSGSRRPTASGTTGSRRSRTRLGPILVSRTGYTGRGRLRAPLRRRPRRGRRGTRSWPRAIGRHDPLRARLPRHPAPRGGHAALRPRARPHHEPLRGQPRVRRLRDVAVARRRRARRRSGRPDRSAGSSVSPPRARASRARAAASSPTAPTAATCSSGTLSPTLGKNIATAMIDARVAGRRAARRRHPRQPGRARPAFRCRSTSARTGVE